LQASYPKLNIKKATSPQLEAREKEAKNKITRTQTFEQKE
jgi:hypothetical protein